MPRILLLSLIMLAVVRPFLRAEDAKTNPLQCSILPIGC
jgi:hypothetical protein